jgi:hypothetical protein
VARQSAGRRNAAEAETARQRRSSPADQEAPADTEVDETDELDETEDEAEEPDELEEQERSAETDALWESVKIDVVEIALPKGVGYTLRAYRLDNELTPTDISEREGDAFPDRERPVRRYVTDEKAILDEDEDDDDIDSDDVVEDEYDEDEDEDDADTDEDVEDADDELAEDDEEEDDEDGDGEEEQAVAEPEHDEVPVFLGGRGKLYLFRTAEGLAEFVTSGAEHDMSQLASWPDLVERLSAEDVVPLAEDRYELDLVVDNLRAGHDGWDPDLLIRAGEVARDIAYALRLEPVQAALSPGSPLDDLDEAMRSTAGGGIGGFLARRKLRKIGAEAAPLGWRTIIGKISTVVDWRD